jgi:hypothetical protein
MKLFPHAGFIAGVMPISDLGLGHIRQMVGNAAEDSLQEAETIRTTAPQTLARGRRMRWTIPLDSSDLYRIKVRIV